LNFAFIILYCRFIFREPLFVEQNDSLFFFFFQVKDKYDPESNLSEFISLENAFWSSLMQGGTNLIEFEPKGLFRMKRLRLGEWTAPEVRDWPPLM